MPFIVIIGQVVGNPQSGYATCWSSDLEQFRTIKAAIRHGFKSRESDDFRIGHISNGNLKSVSWMGTKHFDSEEIRDTADQIGLQYWLDDDGCGIGWGN